MGSHGRLYRVVARSPLKSSRQRLGNAPVDAAHNPRDRLDVALVSAARAKPGAEKRDGSAPVLSAVLVAASEYPGGVHRRSGDVSARGADRRAPVAPLAGIAPEVRFRERNREQDGGRNAESDPRIFGPLCDRISILRDAPRLRRRDVGEEAQESSKNGSRHAALVGASASRRYFPASAPRTQRRGRSKAPRRSSARAAKYANAPTDTAIKAPPNALVRRS